MAELRVALEQISVKTPEEQPSIAVLPFANMSADKENEYFSDGLAEEILNLLAKIPGLKVIARTSAFAFRGKKPISARSLSASTSAPFSKAASAAPATASASPRS